MSGKSRAVLAARPLPDDCRPPLSAGTNLSAPTSRLAAPLTTELEGPNALGSTGASFDTHREKKDSTSVAEFGHQAQDGEQPTEVSSPSPRSSHAAHCSSCSLDSRVCLPV